jgi:uncharacterized protein YigE (DUF2233 family)
MNPVTFWMRLVSLAAIMLLCSMAGTTTPETGLACSSSIGPLSPALPADPPPLDEAHASDAAAPAGPLVWTPVAPGVELRHIAVPHVAPLPPTTVSVVRMSQEAVRFEVGYAPNQPRLLHQWCADPDLLAAINGGFFNEDYQSSALIISNGIANGTSYEAQGGMFAVDAWGNVSLRYLPNQPYTPDEQLVQAIQGWPMLIQPGGGPLYAEIDQEQRARRSVIAMDTTGNVLLLAFPVPDFTLAELTDWLVASDLNIDSALNLDGGSSTGMCVQGDTVQERVPAYSLLPSMLLVYPR